VRIIGGFFWRSLFGRVERRPWRSVKIFLCENRANVIFVGVIVGVREVPGSPTAVAHISSTSPWVGTCGRHVESAVARR
jgi:hypothetical protein